MTQVKSNKIVPLAIFTSLTICLINVGTSFALYSLFAKSRQPAQTAAADAYDIDEIYLASVSSEETVDETSEPDTTTQAAQVTGTQKPSTKPVATRPPEAPITIGAPPKPAVVIITPDAPPIYKWCSGKNVDLPDGVCKAIISIAANPTSANPHLSPQVVQWLSLLPPNSSMTIQEDTWEPDGNNKGDVTVTMLTQSFGNIPLLISLEHKGDLWIVMEGKSQ